MNAIQLAGFAVCAAAMALVMRKLRPEAASVLIIAAGALVLLLVLPQLGEIVNGVAAMAAFGGLKEEYMTSLLKVAGVSLLVDFSVQTCRDAGEEGLALRIELAGRIILIAMALPVMQALLTQILSFSS